MAAKFSEWIKPGTRRHRKLRDGSYQDDYHDPGNWSSGKIGQGTLIGTNRSIAAMTLISWRGQTVTAQDMRNLSRSEATKIYKAKFWDRVKGDQITSQLIANLAADMRSSGGGNGIKPLQRALNKLGFDLKIDGAIGSNTLAAINTALNRYGEKQLYEGYRKQLLDWYAQANPRYRNAWIKRLNQDYPPYDQLNPDRKKKSSNLVYILCAFILSVLVYLAYHRRQDIARWLKI